MDQPALTAPFVHHGRTGAIVRVALVNLLLNIVTFSIWRFWGKTRVRRALWAGTSAWGDPAEYTGTGGELFLGFIVIMVAVYSPIMVAMTAAQIAMTAGNPIGTLVVLLLLLLVFVLAAAGLYRARRYQLSRTVWRGIRGGQGGNAIHYGLLYLGVTLVVMLSLGWALPWAEMQLACYRMDNTTFGDARFTCNARAKPLYKRYAVLWVAGLVFFAGIGLGIAGIVEAYDPENEEDLALMILGLYGLAIPWSLLTLGVPMAWYRAGFFRELAAHTRFDGIGFALEATTGGLIRLALGNWFISVLSLGILRPWAAVRTFRYACNHLRMEAEPNWERVHQNQAELARTGEGLAAVFEGAGEF